MIRINEAVIVEGKYDKIKLSNFIDATIIPTNGFSVFKDKEKRKLIKLLSDKKGLVVITDSDSAGMMIRSYLKKICGEDKIKNVYIPQIIGKEKRKAVASKEGYLGVEGLSEQIITDALERSGVIGEAYIKTKKITKQDLFALGLSGGINSNLLRESFASFSGLPKGMSSSAFLDSLNAVYNYNEFVGAVEKWQSEGDKR
ncbi:MAG: DUF4093 domain-containing protein [Clostridia bacterium]|nr:DUF4093 domain-containing protein [Clostridia bacterium]